MKFTKVRSDTFEQIQLNAGILLSDFDPSTGELDASDIIGATSGGVNFTATPNYLDFGEDVDNVPNNTKELKKIDYYDVKMGGTFVTVTADNAKMLIGSADVSSGTVTPRADLAEEDFETVWWVGDYSDKNGDSNGGFIAIELLNSLSTGGFQIQSSDKGKGQFSFEFTGHYSLNSQSTVPFVIYVQSGTPDANDTSLSALGLTNVTLSPSFSKNVNAYTGSTTSSTSTIAATARDNTATVVVKLDGATTGVSGTTITWGDAGYHVLTVTITSGNASETYTVTVLKS